MGKIILLPAGLRYRTAYLEKAGLPRNCMEDYSVLGLVVDRFDESLRVLGQAGYEVEHSSPWATITLEKYSVLTAVVGLLADNHIRCDCMDIADTLYQS